MKIQQLHFTAKPKNVLVLKSQWIARWLSFQHAGKKDRLKRVRAVASGASRFNTKFRIYDSRSPLFEFSSVAESCLTLCDPTDCSTQASLSITNSWGLFKLMSIESVMPSNHLMLCHPLLLLPSIFPGIRVFSNESFLCIRWPKYCSFCFSTNPSNEHPGLISFRIDWLDLNTVQGTLKSLLQHHSSKASIFWRSAFFIVQLSHPYMTTRKKSQL